MGLILEEIVESDVLAVRPAGCRGYGDGIIAHAQADPSGDIVVAIVGELGNKSRNRERYKPEIKEGMSKGLLEYYFSLPGIKVSQDLRIFGRAEYGRQMRSNRRARTFCCIPAECRPSNMHVLAVAVAHGNKLRCRVHFGENNVELINVSSSAFEYARPKLTDFAVCSSVARVAVAFSVCKVRIVY